MVNLQLMSERLADVQRQLTLLDEKINSLIEKPKTTKEKNK